MYWINSHFNFFEIAFARLHVTFRPWRGITFAKKIHWRTLCIIVRTMVIFLNRHHQNHSEQPGKQRKQDKICLSGAYTRCCYCVKSELFCPRCLNEQLFAAPLRASNVCDDGSFSSPKECAPALSRPRDVACDSRAKGCYDWFCRCRAFLVLFERQKARIERLEEKLKWTIKVGDCREM